MSNPSAYIHPEAKIAESAVIEPFAFVDKNVEIGEGTWIGPGAVISEGSRIGKNCKIYPGACISAVPQDLKFEGEITTTIIGDNTTIREYCTISRGTVDKYKTSIGSNCLLMAYVHVAHDCHLGDNVIIGNATQVAGHAVIDDWAIINGTCGVIQFIRVGKHAFVAPGLVVRKDVPPYIKAAREPVSYAGINSIGLSRRGFTGEQILQLQDIYRRLFLSGENLSEALSKIEVELPATTERDEVVNFIRNSSRGIIKGPSFS